MIYWVIEPYKTCDSPVMVTLIDKVIELLKQEKNPKFSVPSKQPKYLNNLRDHIKVILCNLISAEQTNLNVWVSFLKGSDFYRLDSKNKGFQFTSVNVNKVTDLFIKHDFVEFKPGKKPKKGLGFASKMRGTPKLFRFIGTPLFELVIYKDNTHIPPISMKGKKCHWRTVTPWKGKPYRELYRKDVQIPERYNKKAREITANLKKINNILDKAKLELDIDQFEFEELNIRLSKHPDKYKRPIDLSNKYLYRVFHDSGFDKHGRFYGAWCMGIPENYRERIMIDRMPSVEFDFKSIHPSILYCREGIDIPEEDLYFLPGYGIDPKDSNDPIRKFIKGIMLIAINSKGDDSTFRAFCRKWNQKRKKARRNGEPIPEPPKPLKLKKPVIIKILSELRERHKPIQKYFDDGTIGNILMNYDSQIAEKVMMHFVSMGVPCMPVHDSFIVPVNHGIECYQVMRKEFKKLMDQEIPVDGSVIDSIRKAWSRSSVLKRSSEWDELENEGIPAILEDNYSEDWSR